MKITILLLIAGCMCFVDGFASVSGVQDGRTTAEQSGCGSNSFISRPRSKSRNPYAFQITVEPESATMVITTYEDVGQVYAIVEQCSSGTTEVFAFDSSETAFLPLNNNEEGCLVLLFSESGSSTCCYVEP